MTTPEKEEKRARWWMRGFKEMARKIENANLTKVERAKAIESYTKLAYLMLNGKWLDEIKVEPK